MIEQIRCAPESPGPVEPVDTLWDIVTGLTRLYFLHQPTEIPKLLGEEDYQHLLRINRKAQRISFGRKS